MSSENKKVKNATPLVYDGIKFKSNLEVYCYKRLKEEGIPAEYENHRFILQEGFTFNNKSHEVRKYKGEKHYGDISDRVRGISYTPDFVGSNFIIETKGHPNDAFPIKWKLFKKYLVNNNMNYELFVPRNKKQVDETIEIIKRRYYSETK